MRRRQFMQRLAGAAATASAGALAPGVLAVDRAAGAAAPKGAPRQAAPAPAKVRGSNDRVNLALIGCGGRGRLVAGLMRQVENVAFTAVADVYAPHAEDARAWAGPGCRAYGDFRKLLEQKDVDAVLVATPDHWHATAAVLACQAGKDVYVEKPLAHTVREGRAMVEAARRYRRVVEAGTQHRSAPHLQEAARIVRSGEIGPVHFVRVWNYLNMAPDGIGRAADSAPPAGLDWDFYLGPAPAVPFNKNRFLVTYRWFWDYAGGMATDYGTHRFDTVHQVMGATAPLSATAAGGRYVLQDGAETPDTLQITYEYPGFVLSYEASMVNGHGSGGRTPGKSYYLTRGADDRPHGMAFYGTNGTLYADRVGFEVYPEPQGESGPGAVNTVQRRAAASADDYRMSRYEAAGADATDRHVRNFIECVRSRATPVCDVETGHHSTIVPHLGNTAFRTGRKIRWDAAKEEIIGDPEASAMLGRKARPPWDLIR